MPISSNSYTNLILKLPLSELVNMLQLYEEKIILINVNDTLHDDLCSGYYTLTNWYINEENDSQVIIDLNNIYNYYNMHIEIYSPEALNNPELYTPTNPSPEAY